MELRTFFLKSNFTESATASSYLETVSDQTHCSTKLSCSIYGPMQKQQDFGGQSAESCSIKVILEFADTLKQDSLVLEQYPQIEEQLQMQMASMPTKGSADSVKEKRLKFVVGAIQFEMIKILTSCVITHKYPATTLSFNFRIVELDSDIIQSMTNCAAIALFNSNIECRCIPIGISLYLKGDRKQRSKQSQKNEIDWLQLDPTLSQIKSQNQFSHKVNMTVNVNTDELISTVVQPLGKFTPMELAELETVTGVAIMAAKKIHAYIIGEHSVRTSESQRANRPKPKFEEDVIANRTLFVTNPIIKDKLSRLIGNGKTSQSVQKRVHQQNQVTQAIHLQPQALPSSIKLQTFLSVVKQPSNDKTPHNLDQQPQIKLSKNNDKQSSDEEDVLYRPQKMFENKNDRFYMSFNKEKKRDTQALWGKLTYIVTQSQGKEYSKFLNKIQQMQSYQEKAESDLKRKQLRQISTTRRNNLMSLKSSPNVGHALNLYKQTSCSPPTRSHKASFHSMERERKFSFKKQQTIKDSPQHQQQRKSVIFQENIIDDNPSSNNNQNVDRIPFFGVTIEQMEDQESSDNESKADRPHKKIKSERHLRQSIKRQQKILAQIIESKPHLTVNLMKDNKTRNDYNESKAEQIAIMNSNKVSFFKINENQRDLTSQNSKKTLTQTFCQTYRRVSSAVNPNRIYKKSVDKTSKNLISFQTGDSTQINTLLQDYDFNSCQGEIGDSHFKTEDLRINTPNNQVTPGRTNQSHRYYQQHRKSKSYYTQQESLYGTFQADVKCKSLKQRAQEEYLKIIEQMNKEEILKKKKRKLIK